MINRILDTLYFIHEFPFKSEEIYFGHFLIFLRHSATELTVRDLWDRPGRVAQYLGSLPFVDLPALARPPPEPPPFPF